MEVSVFQPAANSHFIGVNKKLVQHPGNNILIVFMLTSSDLGLESTPSTEEKDLKQKISQTVIITIFYFLTKL